MHSYKFYGMIYKIWKRVAYEESISYINWYYTFVGIGAMAGGFGAIMNPNNPMGMTTEALKNSPFTNFLIPGIFLFAVLGIGNIVSAVAFTLVQIW